MAFKPYMTSNDLIESVKRKIAFPISQNTFTELDILAFANEEMFIAQVPTVLQFHEEYFVTYKIVPLQTNLSRYPIPDRATGMKLRDLFWQDQNGNLFEMTRIEEHDKAFFQRNVGANQAIHKFYIEGNYVVLTPGVVNSPTGSLVFVFYLRPNQLVKDDRAATIKGFTQTIKINNSLINALDTVDIGTFNTEIIFPFSDIANVLPNTFTAVNSLGGTISSIIAYSSNAVLITTTTNHQLTTGQFVDITGSNSNPVIDGNYMVNVVSPTTFFISFTIGTPGTTGTFTSNNQFLIGASSIITAANLTTAINASDIIQSASSISDTITLLYSDINSQVTTTNPVGFLIPTATIGIEFDTLPSTYTDQETNITENLFNNSILIDFLKTKPGHQTYLYDVLIPKNGISGTSILFQISNLLVPTGTVNNSASGSASIQMVIANLQVGDYICLANEAIIPQIPPDLHNGLAERTSARIMAAQGDQAGLQASMAKIQEIDTRQGNLLDNRSEGTPQKVTNRHSMLRYGKLGVTRRT